MVRQSKINKRLKAQRSLTEVRRNKKAEFKRKRQQDEEEKKKGGKKK